MENATRPVTFGDEHSNLLDRFERMSFEEHLNRAILSRSLSEPTRPLISTRHHHFDYAPEPQIVTVEPAAEVNQRKEQRWLGFRKVLKKLLKPVFGKTKEKWKRGEGEMVEDDQLQQRHFGWKRFNRSMRC
ncbi:hypothetical protein QQ045_022215 [Rhodiola kirilowii]